jgi:hypothetical protein
MLNVDKNLVRYNLTQIRVFTAIVSLIVSIYAIYSDDIINIDGILYLKAAELFVSGNMEAAFAAYNWPFYSIIIALFHKLTSIPLELTAYILSCVFFVLLTDALILISSLIFPVPRQLKISALLILCLMPILDYRDYIIRDPGYWAFVCIALYYFMVFLNSSRIIHGTLWQIFMIFAIFFRIEGIFLLITLPLFILLSKKLRDDLVIRKLVSCFFVSIILLATIPFMEDLATKHFSKIYSILNYINLNFVFEKFIFSAEILERQVLNKWSEEYATFILFFGFLALLIYKVVEGFSISYILILLASFKNSSQSANNLYRDFFVYFLMLNSLVLLVFVLKENFISSRYVVLTSISLFLLLSFYMVTGIERLYLKKNKLLLVIIALCLSYNLLDAATTSRNKSYIKDISLLSAQKVPEKSIVLVNDRAVFYYLTSEAAHLTVCFLEKKPIDTMKLKLKKDSCNNDKHSQKYFKSYLYFDYILLVQKNNDYENLRNLSGVNLEKIIQTKNLKEDKAILYKVVK